MTALGPSAARAQIQVPVTADTVSDLLPNVYVAVLNRALPAVLDVFRTNPPADIEAQVTAGLVQAFVLNQRIGAQLSTFPLGSSAGGFSFTFNSELGTFERETNSFGPTFAERAMMVGRGQVNFGVNYQRSTFDHMEDRSLQGGDIKNYLGGCIAVNACVVVENSLNLKLSTDTVGIFATYGVLDRFDVGVAVPIVHVTADAQLQSRVGSTLSAPGDVIVAFSGSSSKSGVGDITLRGKYSVYKEPGGGLAVGLDLRLPTGNEENLLGVAGMQAKMFVAASRTIDRFSPHLNFGYTASGESAAARSENIAVFAPPNELNVVGGADFSVNERLTVVGDVLVRSLRDFGTFELESTRFGSQFRQLTFAEGSLTQALVAAGAKFSPTPRGLVAINVLVPVNKRGLTDSLTLLAGFEYGF